MTHTRASTLADRPRILLVGEGAPARGGIPSFIAQLQADEELAELFDLRHLNTAPSARRRPGGWSPGNLIRVLSDAAHLMRSARGADLVHLQVAPAPLAPLLRTLVLTAAARAAGRPVVVHAHSGRLHRSLASGLYRRALAGVLSICAAFVVVSRREQVAVETALRERAEPVRLIANGVDVDAWTPRLHRAPTTSADEPRVRVAFVGTVCARKGLLDLRAAIRSVATPLDIRIIGDDRQEGPDAAQIIHTAFDDPSPHRVAFLGALPAMEVADELSRADLFVLPSHWEGQPLSVLEAMASGVPVVATDVGDVAAMVGPGGIVVPAQRPDRLGAAIATLASDPAQRTELGRRARLEAEHRHDHRTVTAAIGALYDEVLERLTPDSRGPATTPRSLPAPRTRTGTR